MTISYHCCCCSSATTINELICCLSFGCHIVVSTMAPGFSVNVCMIWGDRVWQTHMGWHVCAWWQHHFSTIRKCCIVVVTAHGPHMHLFPCWHGDPCHPEVCCCVVLSMTIKVMVASGDSSYGKHWWGVVEDVVEGRELWVVNHGSLFYFVSANMTTCSDIKDWLEMVFDQSLISY